MYRRTRRSNHAVSKTQGPISGVSQPVARNISEVIYKTNGKTTRRERIYYIHTKSQKIKLIHFQEFVQYLSFYNIKAFVIMIYRESLNDFFLSHNKLW